MSDEPQPGATPRSARTPDPERWCALRARHHAEPVAGSAASGVQRWLLVEHPARWGPKPPEGCDWAPAEAERIAALGKAVPEVRLQLLRRPQQKPSQPRAWLAGPEGRWSLDWARLMGGTLESAVELLRQAAPTEAGEAVDGAPWYLVCTHGKRDRCCAMWGQPIFEALAGRPELADRVWQTTHLGGHRFAPTLVTLPGGLCYGHVEDEDLDALVAATEAGQVGPVERLRGPCHEDAPGQVAWAAAATHWPQLRWRELELERSGDPKRPQIRCRWGAKELPLQLAPAGRPLEVMGSCGDPPAKRRVPWVASPI